MLRFLRRVGLARLLRLGLTLAIPPLWYEIAVLHYRGAFQNRFMWIPVLSLPAVMASGVASALKREERRARDIFRPFAWWMAIVGTVGSLFHLRGIARQMGGFYNWKYNVVTGPPILAPAQVALLGLLSVAASRRVSYNLPGSKHGDEVSLVQTARWVNALSYLLIGIEAGYNHWTGNFFNRLMYTPLLVNPVVALVHFAALWRSRLAQTLELPLSALSTLVGLVGFNFHIGNLLGRPGRLSWQNLFYGPPIMVPLQITGQGLMGVLIALFSKKP
jgi:hypothetical protein